jgi:hypothetical protein
VGGEIHPVPVRMIICSIVGINNECMELAVMLLMMKDLLGGNGID